MLRRRASGYWGVYEGWLTYLGRALGDKGSSRAGVDIGCERSCRSLSERVILHSIKGRVEAQPTSRMKLSRESRVYSSVHTDYKSQVRVDASAHMRLYNPSEMLRVYSHG